MFAGLWPGFDTAEVPIGSVTNGVHAPTWVAAEIVELGPSGCRSRSRAGRRRQLGRRLGRTPPTARSGRARRELRAGWSAETRRRLRASWLQRGASARPSWPGPTSVLDPDVLTIGFARRVPSYKRLTLMLRDPDRLRRAAARPGAAGADHHRGQGPSRRRRR